MFYHPEPVDRSPDVILAKWSVFEFNKNELTSRHFVGFNLLSLDGRVSSPIEVFDKETMTGITKSGRSYRLRGQSGVHEDALYVFFKWKVINGANDNMIIDVTGEYL